jgi:hypothetical protein
MAAGESGRVDALRQVLADAGPLVLGVIAVLAMILVPLPTGGTASAADDNHLVAVQSGGANDRTYLDIPRNAAAPRVYVPVHPVNPSQVDEPFGIVPDSGFAPPSEMLGRLDRGRSVPPGKDDRSRAEPRSAPRLPEAAAK